MVGRPLGVDRAAPRSGSPWPCPLAWAGWSTLRPARSRPSPRGRAPDCSVPSGWRRWRRRPCPRAACRSSGRAGSARRRAGCPCSTPPSGQVTGQFTRSVFHRPSRRPPRGSRPAACCGQKEVCHWSSGLTRLVNHEARDARGPRAGPAGDGAPGRSRERRKGGHHGGEPPALHQLLGDRHGPLFRKLQDERGQRRIQPSINSFCLPFFIVSSFLVQIGLVIPWSRRGSSP